MIRNEIEETKKQTQKLILIIHASNGFRDEMIQMIIFGF